jgi:urea-proton symporter
MKAEISTAGYGVVVGLGALFAIGMIFISNTLAKRGNLEDTEEFTVAKRQIGTGLTAAAVISVGFFLVDSRR